MSDLNRTFIEGRLTRDPEIREIPGKQTKVCDIHIASNRYTPNEGADGEERQYLQHPTYVKVTLWGTQAEKWGTELQTGDKVSVEGRLADDNYLIRGEDEGESVRTRGRLKVDQVTRIVRLRT
jgi:single stranded DNA-binding protein